MCRWVLLSHLVPDAFTSAFKHRYTETGAVHSVSLALSKQVGGRGFFESKLQFSFTKDT